jgi:apolipoprotein N-acyltransferase
MATGSATAADRARRRAGTAAGAGGASTSLTLFRWGRGLRPSRYELTVAAASGIMFALAFPPLPLALVVAVCLVPLAAGVARAADCGAPAGSAARIGVWFAAVGFGIALYWIAVALSLFTSLAFLAYLATLVGMAALVAGTMTALYVLRRLTRWPMALLLPATWVSLELLLAYFSDLAFPWFPLGLAVATHPVFAQAADLSGVHGLSVWLAATNGLIADAWLAARPAASSPGERPPAAASSRRALVPLAAALGLAIAVWGYGTWRLRSVVLAPLARVGIVQPNIPEDEKMQRAMQGRFIDPLAALTRQLETQGRPQLVLWPETALPDFLTNHPDWTDSLRTLARGARTPILFGMIDYALTGPGRDDFDFFNAATLVDSAGRIGTQPAYHKMYLVPIVERVPFVNPRWFAGLKYFGGFGRGDGAQPFALPFGRVGVLICYESIFPQQSRRYRRAGADLIVNLTNDAWFGRSLAPYQHEAHLRLRAIENRVGLVRAANTGISEYIDPLGRPHGATRLFTPAVVTYDAQTTALRSPYVALGDWAAGICAITTLTLLAWAAGRRWRAWRPST